MKGRHSNHEFRIITIQRKIEGLEEASPDRGKIEMSLTLDDVSKMYPLAVEERSISYTPAGK